MRPFDIIAINRLVIRENNRQIAQGEQLKNYAGWQSLRKIAEHNCEYALSLEIGRFSNDEKLRRLSEDDPYFSAVAVERFLTGFDQFVAAAAPLLEWVPGAGTMLTGAKWLYGVVRNEFPIT